MGPTPLPHSPTFSDRLRRAPSARIWFCACALVLLAGGLSPSARAQVIETVAGGFNLSALPSE